MAANVIRRLNVRSCPCKYCSNLRSQPFYKGLRNTKGSKNAFSACSRLRNKYGLTMEQYDFMLHFQQNACAICFRTSDEIGRKLAVDHCHKTGKIRALLCSNCNTAVGLLNENGGTAYRLAMYLQGPWVAEN